MVYGEGHLRTSTASSRQAERNSGRGVQSNEGQVRLDALPTSLSVCRLQAGPAPLEVDLFASRLSNQLPTVVSWRPDPKTMATDAFVLDWKNMKAYTNLPWSLVGRVLAQAQQQEADLTHIACIWKAQPWYPALLEMCRDFPRVLPERHDLIQPTHPISMPKVLPQLAAWSISGNSTKSKAFGEGYRTHARIIEREVLKTSESQLD